jgi:hypothetical protein
MISTDIVHDKVFFYTYDEHSLLANRVYAVVELFQPNITGLTSSSFSTANMFVLKLPTDTQLVTFSSSSNFRLCDSEVIVNVQCWIERLCFVF